MRKGMDQGWAVILRHAIPLVLEDMDRGASPAARETVRAESKRAWRAEPAARRANP